MRQLARTFIVLLVISPLPLVGQTPAAVDARPESASQVAPAPDLTVWRPMFAGVELASFQSNQPRRLRGHLARIDLTTPGLEIVTTAPNGERELETDAIRTSTFLRQNNLQLAINAGPFAPVHPVEGRPVDVVGLKISNGEIVSPPDTVLPALLVRQGNRVSIESPPFSDLENVETAVTGFAIILADGKVRPEGQDLHPRTAAGLDRERRTLFLVVVDGRQRDSEGMTTAELAAWLRDWGAWEAINLDGGGTTTMVIAGRRGRPQVVNRPIHAPIPGIERPSGSHLGIRTRPASDAMNDESEVLDRLPE